MFKSIPLLVCFILLISPIYSNDIPDINLNIAQNASVNNASLPDIDLIIKENSSIPHIDIKVEEFKLPNVDLTIKNNSTIPHIDIPVNQSLPNIDIKVEEFKLPNVDLTIKNNSNIPHIDIPVNQSLPNIDIKVENFKLPEVDLDIKGASNKSKVDETKAAIKKDKTDIDLIIDDAETEDSDDDEEIGQENNKGVCDITLITPEGRLYERLVQADNKSNKLKADSTGILYLVVNTHTCLCKITGLALHKENKGEKPFLKIKPTEKELQATYKFPFPVKVASFKCSNTA